MTEVTAEPVNSGGLFGHPTGLSVLFMTETWERFSYYGMRALLVLYMVKHELQPETARNILFYPPLQRLLTAIFGPLSIQATASQFYGIYTALVYLTPILGGFIADRYWGARRTVIAGALLMSLGHFLMAFENLFLVALLCIIVGNGAFKPNSSIQVGRLYAPGDLRRDRAYGIFYVGINLGAFFSPFVAGSLGEEVGWDWGFGSAGVGMLIATLTYIGGGRHLPPDPPRARKSKRGVHLGLTPTERKTALALGVIFLLTPLFWAVFEQQGNTLALYSDTEIDRNIGLFGHSFEFPTSWVQSINPFFIFTLTPLVTWYWARQAAREREPGSIVKMSIGCVLTALSFLVLCGATLVTPAGGKASWLWLIGHFLLLTLGELYLSPIGLSLVSKVAPVRLASMLMGWCFIANFIGNYLSGWLGAYWGVIPHGMFFLGMAGIAAVAAILIGLLNRPLTRLTGLKSL